MSKIWKHCISYVYDLNSSDVAYISNNLLCFVCTQTELNYMDPGNLEFSEELHNSAHKHETDQTVQYGNLTETPQYTNVM